MSGCVIDARDDAAFFDDLTRRAAEARVPLDASIELTHRCNLRCVHCYLGDQDAIRRHRAEELSTAEVRALLDELAEAGTLNLTFTGGDPMVRRDFPELYEHAVRNGFLVTVFCDGAALTPGTRRAFRRFPPRKVEVSVYGASAGVYESVTRVPGSHARCMEGIAWLRAQAIPLTLKTVLMRGNRHELDAMRALAHGLEVPFYFDTAIFPCLPHGDNAGRANRRARRAAPSRSRCAGATRRSPSAWIPAPRRPRTCPIPSACASWSSSTCARAARATAMRACTAARRGARRCTSIPTATCSRAPSAPTAV